MLSKEPSVSFVVNSVDNERFERFKKGVVERLTCGDLEVVRIADAASMAEGYNRGAKRARGDWLIFCHDDIAIVSSNPWREIVRATRKTDVFGTCGTRLLVSGNWYDAGVPFTVGSVIAPAFGRAGMYELQVFGAPAERIVTGIRALDGIFIACRRSVFDALLGFDEKRFTDFHGYDAEFTFRASLTGIRLGIATRLVLLHESEVGKFTADKVARWEEAQGIIQDRFGRYLSTEPGQRQHKTIPLLRIDDGPDVLEYCRAGIFGALRRGVRRIRRSTCAYCDSAHGSGYR